MTFGQKHRVPIVFSANGRPDHHYEDTVFKRPAFLSEHLRNSFKHLAGCQILFDSYRGFLPKSFNGKLFTIPNPVDQVREEDVVVHIARLDDYGKQQSMSMEAFSKIAEKHPKRELHFWGFGGEEPVLRGKIEKLRLRDRIFLNGLTDNPIEKLRNADMQNLMEKLMTDHELRNRLGKQANRDMQKYDPKTIADKWEEPLIAMRE